MGLGIVAYEGDVNGYIIVANQYLCLLFGKFIFVESPKARYLRCFLPCLIVQKSINLWRCIHFDGGDMWSVSRWNTLAQNLTYPTKERYRQSQRNGTILRHSFAPPRKGQFSGYPTRLALLYLPDFLDDSQNNFHFQPFIFFLGLNEKVRQVVDSGACVKASLRALLDVVPNRLANVSNPANFLLLHVRTRKG
jgi:hypothetical protein